MRTKFTLLAILAVAFFSAEAQTIPNSSFETWTSPSNPDGWATYSSVFGFNIGLCAKDSLDKVVGANSVKVYSDSVPGQPSYGVVAGVVSTGTGAAPQGAPEFTGIAFPYAPDTLFFGYKFVSPSMDTAVMTVEMTKNGVGVFTGNAVGFAVPLDTTSTWQLAYVILKPYYSSTSIHADTLLLQFLSGNHVRHQGSVLHVDGVFFSASSPATGVNEVSNTIEVNVFPNPATTQLNIQSTESLEGHQVVITDMNGKLVRIRPLTNGITAIDLSDVASGTYIYRIADKSGRFIKQDRFNVSK